MAQAVLDSKAYGKTAVPSMQMISFLLSDVI